MIAQPTSERVSLRSDITLDEHALTIKSRAVSCSRSSRRGALKSGRRLARFPHFSIQAQVSNVSCGLAGTPRTLLGRITDWDRERKTCESQRNHQRPWTACLRRNRARLTCRSSGTSLARLCIVRRWPVDVRAVAVCGRARTGRGGLLWRSAVRGRGRIPLLRNPPRKRGNSRFASTYSTSVAFVFELCCAWWVRVGVGWV